MAATSTLSGASAPSGPTTPTAAVSVWKPDVGATWQWQLHGALNTQYAVGVYDIDLFDAPQATINALKARGARVICYFSAGSSEDWRLDYAQFRTTDLGNALPNWPGERWLDVRSDTVRVVMVHRLDLAVAKGCDGVEPDNVDGYATNNGFSLSANDQLAFNTFIAEQAHARGLAVALKNDLPQIPALVDLFDFAVNEQCFEFGECAAYAAFISRGKPVFNAEYAARFQANSGGARDALCAQSHAAKLHTVVLAPALDGSYRFSCD